MEVHWDNPSKTGNTTNNLDHQLKISETNTSPITVFHRIPVEIWETILLHFVNAPGDLYSAYNAWSKWGIILESKMEAWMFAKVVPMLVQYLSKEDILKCRLVCKRWCSAIDYFCENNVHRRPAFGEDENEISWKMDTEHKIFRTTYGYNTFHSSRWVPLKPNENFLKEAASHPRNPFVGRCVMVVHCRNPLERQEEDCRIGNEFLEKFGRYIYFLQICFYDKEPVEFLKSFVELFQFADLSNLKSLEIKKVTYMGICYENEICARINEYIDSLTCEQIKRFPKNLETLICDMSQEVGGQKLKQILMKLFSGSIKTLEFCKDTFTCPLPIQLNNLCDLRTTIENIGSLQSLLHVTSPIRRLYLNVGISNQRSVSCVSKCWVELLIRVINRFQNTLGYLKLNLRPKECTSESLSLLMTPNCLQLPYIKTVVFGICPVSFNFLCGLSSLEYFHVKRILMYEKDIFKPGNIEEKLDIGRILMENYDREKIVMRYPNLHESNVWTVFKRLKIISVEVHEKLRRQPKLWEYRRSQCEML